jgi:hypothetical protein
MLSGISGDSGAPRSAFDTPRFPAIPNRLGAYAQSTSGSALWLLRALRNVYETAEAIVKKLEASLSFSGALPRNTTRRLPAAVSFSAALPRNVTRALASSLSFSAALPRATTRRLAGSLSFAGALPRSTVRSLAASLSPTANLGRTIAKPLPASLSFAASLPRAITHRIQATLGLSGRLELFQEVLAQAVPTRVVLQVVRTGVKFTKERSRAILTAERTRWRP